MSIGMRSVSTSISDAAEARPPLLVNSASSSLELRSHLGGHDVAKLSLLAGLALGALREDGYGGLHRASFAFLIVLRSTAAFAASLGLAGACFFFAACCCCAFFVSREEPREEDEEAGSGREIQGKSDGAKAREQKGERREK